MLPALAIIAVVTLSLLWVGRLLNQRSATARLAAIEAARAIPDEQNAAVIYDRLMTEYGQPSLPQGIVNISSDRTRTEPWLSEDNPQLAAWIKEQQGLIDGLLQAAKMNECRFPIIGYPKQFPTRMDRLSAMRGWAFLLVRAANNDIAEGRIESAIRKCLALLKLAGHLRQQPVVIENLAGNAVEALALRPIRCFVLEGPCEQRHSEAIEAALSPVKSDWDGYSSKMLQIERLLPRKERKSLFRYILSFWRNDDNSAIERVQELYLRLLADRRGVHVIIALRRYRDRTGKWPGSLEEIRSSAPQDVLVDPSNGGAFVYRLTEDGFTLYSRGKNNIDEDGRRRGGADDWQIWPPYHRTTAAKEKTPDR